MEYITERGRARSRKGEQRAESWTVLSWEAFRENARSPNLVFAVGWNIKQSNKLASAPEGKAGPLLSGSVWTWNWSRGDVKAPAASQGRAGPTCRSARLTCDASRPVQPRKLSLQFLPAPLCSALKVWRSASKQSCISAGGTWGEAACLDF